MSDKSQEVEQFKVQYDLQYRQILEREINNLTEKFFYERKILDQSNIRLNQQIDELQSKLIKAEAYQKDQKQVEAENLRLKNENSDLRDRYFQLEQSLSTFKHMDTENRALR